MNGVENIKQGGVVDINSVTPNFLFMKLEDIVVTDPTKGKVIKENSNKNKDFLDGYTENYYISISDDTPGR